MYYIVSISFINCITKQDAKKIFRFNDYFKALELFKDAKKLIAILRHYKGFMPTSNEVATLKACYPGYVKICNLYIA